MSVAVLMCGVLLGVLAAQEYQRRYQARMLHHSIGVVQEAHEVAARWPVNYPPYRFRAEQTLIEHGVGDMIRLLPDVEDHHHE